LEYAYGDAAQHRERIAALLLDSAVEQGHLQTDGSEMSVG
jgi:hypothetical protein